MFGKCGISSQPEGDRGGGRMEGSDLPLELASDGHLEYSFDKKKK